MRDVDKVKTRFELKLDSSQVFFLFLGLVTYSALLFVLGVVVGRSRRADETIAQSRPLLPDASPSPAITRIEDRLAAAEPKATEEPELPLGFYENLEKGTSPGVSPGASVRPTVKVPASPAATLRAAVTPTANLRAAASPAVSPKPVATARAAATSLARGEFTLQVVSYGEEAQAQGEVAKLTHQGYKDVFLTVGSVAGRTVHRVRIGHYANKSEAEEAASSLAADNPNLKPIVVPLE